VVEVVHHVTLGHDRQASQVRLGEPVDVDSAEASAVERRTLDGPGDDLAQALFADLSDPFSWPT
jgi:hypothetical protein